MSLMGSGFPMPAVVMGVFTPSRSRMANGSSSIWSEMTPLVPIRRAPKGVPLVQVPFLESKYNGMPLLVS